MGKAESRVISDISRGFGGKSSDKSAQMNSQDEKYHKARGDAPAAAAAAAAAQTQSNQKK